MPHLQDLWSEVQEQRGDEVVFVAVNAKDTADIAGRYWEGEGFTFGVACQEESSVTTAFGVTSFPTTYIIDPEGKISFRSVARDLEEVSKHLAP